MSDYKMVALSERTYDYKTQDLYGIVDENGQHAPAISAINEVNSIVIIPADALVTDNGDLEALYTLDNAMRYINILNGGNGLTTGHLSIHEFDLTSLH